VQTETRREVEQKPEYGTSFDFLGYLDGKIGQDKSRGLALKESILLTNFSR
jgi:hypothetical protein